MTNNTNKKIENYGFENEIFLTNINKEKNFLEISSLLKCRKKSENNRDNEILEILSNKNITKKFRKIIGSK